MHQRTPSHSYRIPVTASPPPPSHLHLGAASSASPPLPPAAAPRPRKRHTSDDDPLLAAGAYAGAAGLASQHDHAAGWITSRLGGRPALKRWMLIALGVSASYALLHAATSDSSAAATTTSARTSSSFASWWSAKTKGGAGRDPDQDDLDDWLQPPRVDRSALEKLRLLEIHYGADEDETEGEQGPQGGPSSDGDAGAVRPGDRGGAADAASGKSNGREPTELFASTDAPPLVAEIPDFVKPDPLAPPAPERIPADVLDRRVCGAVDGDSCRFLVPAWLGASSVAFSLSRQLLRGLAFSRRAPVIAGPADPCQ